MDVTTMFTIFINLILFIFFFVTGWDISNDERVLGFVFITFSGIMFISLTTIAMFTSLLHPIYVIPILDPIGIYIIVYGVLKIAGKMKEKEG